MDGPVPSSRATAPDAGAAVARARPPDPGLRAPRPAARFAFVLLPLSVLLIALAARVELPMVPVSMSLQSYAVVVLATLLGFRLAAPVLLLYLLAGALGAPVFAGGAAGAEHLTGSTGGYLAGFLLATAVCGNAVAARHAAAHPLGGTPWMLFAHALILALGAGWLAQTIGWERAVAGGLSPFLLGALVKSLAAALTVWALWRCVRRWLPS